MIKFHLEHKLTCSPTISSLRFLYIIYMEKALALALPFCPTKDIALVCSQVCRQWLWAVELEEVWRSLVEREGYLQLGWQGSWKARFIWARRMARCVYFSHIYGEGLAVYRFNLQTYALSIVRCGTAPLSICPISPSVLYLYSCAMHLPSPSAFQCCFYDIDSNTERPAAYAAPYQHAVCLNDQVFLLAPTEGQLRLDYYSCSQEFALFHAAFLPLSHVYWTIADRDRLYICSNTELGVYLPTTQQYRSLLTHSLSLLETPISCCNWTPKGDIYVFGGDDFDFLICAYSPGQNQLKMLVQEMPGVSAIACLRYEGRMMVVSARDSFKLFNLAAGKLRRLLTLQL